jgi:hypothetical protein
VELFKVNRTEHSDAGVTPGQVVPALYPFEDGVGVRHEIVLIEHRAVAAPDMIWAPAVPFQQVLIGF